VAKIFTGISTLPFQDSFVVLVIWGDILASDIAAILRHILSSPVNDLNI